MAYLWVGLGSALGGMARYWFSLVSVRRWGLAFPWGTIIINIVGSFAIGLFGTMPASADLRTFVMIGVCGGFTTFSSFSLQTLELARAGRWLRAISNVGLSVVACLAAVTLGTLGGTRL